MNTTTTTQGPGAPLTRDAKYRTIGMIIGAAVADALGAPFEFQPAGRYRQRFPTPVLGGTGEMCGGGGFDWAPGEFTDDTQMAIALAESILEADGYDPDAVWRWFRSWASTARDIGNTTRRSLAHEDWRDVPRDGARGAGNGALMRAFVLAAALLRDDDTAVREVVLAQASLTHSDPAAGWGAWIAVEMCRTAIGGGDPLAALDTLVAALPDDVRPGFEPFLASGWSPSQPHPSNGSVWGCLAEAVWALRTTSTFEDAVVAVVDLGGDTDTVGCVTGALAGALYGVQRIPSRWATYVNGSIDTPDGPRQYTGADLQRLARQLLGLGTDSDAPPETAAGPHEVAPGLHAADLLGASTAPNHWAVVSLCRTGTVFAGHPVRRQVFLIDKSGDHNHALHDAVDDAVHSINAFLTEGRTVLVHCHGGRSRTGMVLKAWKMRRDGLTEREAHDWLAACWDRYHDDNPTFVDMLRSEWTVAAVVPGKNS
jgi:ADP-ribosyl-[dinitrogen reductase] hydrolase